MVRRGAGTGAHVQMIMFADAAKVPDLLHVPYRARGAWPSRPCCRARSTSPWCRWRWRRNMPASCPSTACFAGSQPGPARRAHPGRAGLPRRRRLVELPAGPARHAARRDRRHFAETAGRAVRARNVKEAARTGHGALHQLAGRIPPTSSQRIRQWARPSAPPGCSAN